MNVISIEERYNSLLKLGINEVLRLADIGQQMQWVECSERMPNSDGHYIVRNNIGREISYFFKRNGRFIDNNITHWMPLPKPPKGE